MAERCCDTDVTVFWHHWSCHAQPPRRSWPAPARSLRAELDLHALYLGALRSDLRLLRAATRRAADLSAARQPR